MTLRLKIIVVACLPALLTSCGDGIQKGYVQQIVEMVINTCWACNILGYLFNFIDDVINSTQGKIIQVSLGLLSAGYLLWLCMKIMGAIKSMTFGGEGLDGKFWKDFNTRLGLVMFAAILLSGLPHIQWVLDNTVLLILQALINLAVEIVQTVVKGFEQFAKEAIPGTSIESTESSSKVVKEAFEKSKELIVKTPYVSTWRTEGTGSVLAPLRKSMLQLLRGISSLMMSGVAFGYRLMEVDTVWTLLSGYALIAMFTINAIAFPFAVLNSVFRMAFMLALTPKFVVAAVFPSTRGYTKKAFESIVGAGVSLCFTSMYLAFSTMLLFTYLIRSGASDIYRPETMNNLKTEVAKTYAAMTASKTSEMPLYVLVVLSYYLFRLAGKVSKMAEEFVGTFGSDVFSNIQNKLFGYLKKMAIAAAGPVVQIAVKIGGAVAGKIMRRKK